MPLSDVLVLTVLCTGGGAASAVDVASRRIPNALSLSVAAVGLALAAAGLSGVSIVSALIGFGLGLALMLPGHLLGATGAGDVKLFAAAGTLLGAARIVEAFLLVAIAGGVLAIGFAWHRGRLGRTLSNTARLCGQPRTTKTLVEAPGEHNRFPYGPAIALGCVAAMFV